MRLETRRLLDRAFSGTGVIAIGVMALALVVILTPIILKGTGAFVFRATIEHQKVMSDHWGRGNPARIAAAREQAAAARRPVYDMLAAFDAELDAMPRSGRRPYKTPRKELEKALAGLLGPAPGQRTPVLIRQQYGATRWDRAQVKLAEVLFTEEWDYSNPNALGVLVKTPRAEQFEGTAIEPLFSYLQENIQEILRPHWTFYWQFLFDTSRDSHIFGGIGPEVLGTIYLTLGAMIFAIPMGVIAAIYLCEYAREGRVISFLRICISTLAGVPSIVFGLFGLAFFLNTIHVSDSKSVLAGSLTLSLLILPTVIRASEESILAVPKTYKEAALSLGAGRWHTVMTVILPAALPGILTGTVISMGRAAGETAPIIFTAAVSVGRPLLPGQALSQPTPALPWNIYNLCTEHEAVDEIRHVQYGMVFTLVAVVLLLNVFAIVMRARISKKLRG
jgi:phosphate transport system permease protein